MKTDEIWFISDLHLSPSTTHTLRQFCQLIQRCKQQAKALYILGDLFDVWIGDDDPSPLAKTVTSQLRLLTHAGVNVYFQAGNRDFLIGEAFAAATGVTLLPDYHVISLSGQPTLLMHGDLLCSDDTRYQQIRQQIRVPEWRERALAKPLWLRKSWARWYRLRSRFHTRQTDLNIMDVNQNTVQQTMAKFNVTQLIHGHTHRPGFHKITLNGNQSGKRIVLTPWDGEGQALSWTASYFNNLRFP